VGKFVLSGLWLHNVVFLGALYIYFTVIKNLSRLIGNIINKLDIETHARGLINYIKLKFNPDESAEGHQKIIWDISSN
jgi:hypothetical protein